MKQPWSTTLLAAFLFCAAWRGASLPHRKPFPEWTRGGGPETLIPDLAHDDALRLSWLPGVGLDRAEKIVRQRQFLQMPLTPQRLALLPGVGPTTADAVSAWYASQQQVQAAPR